MLPVNVKMKLPIGRGWRSFLERKAKGIVASSRAIQTTLLAVIRIVSVSASRMVDTDS